MYPVMLDLVGKKVVVVGGGRVAAHKVNKLLGQNAEIVVVSPTLTETLHTYEQNGDIHWIQRSFENADIDDAFLVIAATDDRQVNAQVKASCQQHQLVNVADSPEESNFYNMAAFERGKLKIAISTEGASPLLAKQLKRDLNEFFDDSYGEYLSFLFAAREKIKLAVHDEQLKLFLLKEILDDRFRKNERERELFLLHIQ
ncbi:NAD(P)-binding protein [Lysinibacillus yapensis]|uniref:precorrin-2 dehydrogenase n=1 Tax=Ureibacillus yapensis TaxID=2304605 RepID=A0A396S4X1_9BACL|nr:NAD(P)-binding protein [Lysinibacillus yapensis]RHW33254.1 NAD(P)-binding protein [Lysinibacillus yapensis]